MIGTSKANTTRILDQLIEDGLVSRMVDATDARRQVIQHLADLRMGCIVSLVFILLYLPWSAQISAQMRVIEKDSRLLTYTQLISGALTVFVVSWGML